MKTILAFSRHSLWREAFKELVSTTGPKTLVFDNLSELKDFIGQFESAVGVLEQKSGEIDLAIIESLLAAGLTKVLLLTDREVEIALSDERAQIIFLPISHQDLSREVQALLED